MKAIAGHCVIAIDGPAASGKSSVARELARRLQFVYVNSGAMYRAMTWHILQNPGALQDPAAIAAAAEAAEILCDLDQDQSRIRINAIDPAEHLRDPAVNEAVSVVSSVRRVREILVEKMRAYADQHDLVMEGRDIGSVVFPSTPFKFYIDALPDVRFRRRAAEGQRDQIAARDEADSSRRVSPLVVASDAYVIDSSEMSIDQVVSEVMERLRMSGAPAARIL